jgi:proteasome lid subunit RPN8/RPN11
MLQTLVNTANQLLGQLQRSLWRPRAGHSPLPEQSLSQPATYVPLQRAQLTDEVGRTIFEEYAEHRAQSRGEEETGWVILGLREASEAVILATLPAGTEADASVSHIRFNSSAQALASRIVRQNDRRLTILGVVHTHPGSLRHPSDGDFRGDSQWVRHLRGKEGIFAIGTADGQPPPGAPRSQQPRPHVQCWGELRFSWYALRQGDKQYRPLPVEVVYGPDLARPLHSFWSTLELHAERLERPYRQLNGVHFQPIRDEWGPGLVVTLPLAEAGDALRVVIRPKEIRYYLLRGGDEFVVEPGDGQVDRAVYLLLAELAARP